MENKEQSVTVMVGVIGSGKSTKAKELANKNPNTIIISKDVYRSMFKDNYIYRNDIESLIKKCTTDTLYAALYAGFDVVIDETNITRAKRQSLIRYIKVNFKHVKVYAIEFARGPWCIERRLTDLRGYKPETWERVYREMMEEFETVTSEDGFDSYVMIPPPDGKLYRTPVERQREYCKSKKIASFILDKCPKCRIDMNSLAYVHEHASNTLITSCPACGYAFND